MTHFWAMSRKWTIILVNSHLTNFDKESKKNLDFIWIAIDSLSFFDLNWKSTTKELSPNFISTKPIKLLTNIHFISQRVEAVLSFRLSIPVVINLQLLKALEQIKFFDLFKLHNVLWYCLATSNNILEISWKISFKFKTNFDDFRKIFNFLQALNFLSTTISNFSSSFNLSTMKKIKLEDKFPLFSPFFYLILVEKIGIEWKMILVEWRK